MTRKILETMENEQISCESAAALGLVENVYKYSP